MGHSVSPKNADRAELENNDAKSRITIIPTGQANGKSLPLFFIMKLSASSASKPD